MKLHYLLFLLVISAVLLIMGGCKPIAMSYYKLGRQLKFQNRGEYYNYLNTKFPEFRGNFYFADSTTFGALVRNFMNNKPSKSEVFFGIYTDETVGMQIVDTAAFSSGCIGKISKAIASFAATNNYSPFQDSAIIAIRPLNLSTTTRMKIDSGKLNIIVYYLYQMGTLNDFFFRELERIRREQPEQIQLHMVVLDRVYHLKS
jgi:hypothetical protein